MTRRSSTGPLETASDTKVTEDPPGTRLGGSSCCISETGLRVGNTTSVTLIDKGSYNAMEITQAVRDGEFVDFGYTIHKSDCCEEHMEPVYWNDGLKDWRKADQVINNWVHKYL